MNNAPVSSPRFSFVMPAYNAQATIGAAIESVMTQTCDDWELVVCDDGSTDDTSRIVEAYASQEPRIKLVSQGNQGCGAARDYAVANSQAPWIVRFDADDQLFLHYLSAMSEFMKRNPGYDIYSCNGVHVYPDGSTRRARPGAFYEVERSFSYEEMLFRTHIFTVAIFSRDIYERVGGISHTEYCEDLDFWLRALAIGATHRYTPQELALYTVSSSQMSSDFHKIVQSRVNIYTSLLKSGSLSPVQRDETQKAITRILRDEKVLIWRTKLVESVSQLLGVKAGSMASRGVHFIGKHVRAVFRTF